jgi:Bacteriophage holin family, superfamily II-like
MDKETAAVIAGFSSKATYAGSTTAIVSSFTLNDYGIVIGVLIAVAGYFTNLYFKIKDDRRKDKEHHFRLSDLLKVDSE